MRKAEASKRIEKLKQEIEHHRYLYHVLDRQEISDAANDSLKHELQELEQQFPGLITADSPTQRVGGEPRAEFAEVQRRTPMLSLVDVFSEEELSAWEERNRNAVPDGEYTYYCELKVDGLAVELEYADGLLVRASTRGDGRTGEDVTENIKTVESIPLRLRPRAPRTLAVRGEVFLGKTEFNALNRAQERAGKPLYANPRNVAAGSVRQLDPKITASRKLQYMVYDLVESEREEHVYHHEEHAAAQQYGFKISSEAARCASLAEVKKFHEKWAKKRAALPFGIDGIVVTVDHNPTFRRLGVVGKAPRGSVAFKFPAEEATTVIKDILVQVGRTGALTPVAVLEPVAVAGTTVSRATLHNEEDIHRKDVRIGDTVIIRKAGDIIPEVVRMLPRLRPTGARVFHMPKKCPICGSPVKKDDGGAIHRCTNRDCAAQQHRLLRHFVSRAAADIEGVGPKLLDKLIEAGLIRDAADLYSLKKQDVAVLERYAEKSAENIIGSIESRRNVPLGRFLFALGIPHVGSVTAEDLAQRFHTLSRVGEATIDEIRAVEGVGDVVAESIVEFFRRPQTQQLLKKMQRVGVKAAPARQLRRSGPFNGKTVVITGSLGDLTREEAWEHIRSLGGTVSESVGWKTDLLIVGEGSGSKLEKARALKIATMDAKEFLRLVKRQTSR